MTKRIPTRKRLALAIAAGLITPAAATSTAHAGFGWEWEHGSPFYEDDAWYDVSEWFDGNDYNPTDEAIGRWDNETYDASEAVTSGDADNDINWTENDHGYYADTESGDTWFYDYYDYGYSDYGDADDDGNYDYTSNYYDYDNDGVYDAFASYTDTDGDGVFDDATYVSFSDDGGNDQSQREAQQKADQQNPSAKSQSFAGRITRAKQVKTPATTNVVVELQNQDKGQSMIADLGPADKLDRMPQLNDRLTVKGTPFKTGERVVLLSQTIQHEGQQMQVERSGREYKGNVQSTKTVKINNQERQLAKLSTDNGKTMLVDLGLKSKLDKNITEGSQITVTGPAIQVKDRVMLLANQVTLDGDTIDITRMAKK
ncbi:hypothetical protein [Rhodopirellula halodulae]|uniref:hypothetical protein n=1 Tax=Rhodopirellula halodulae TaxID=2894198 RepID=UPI001E3C4A2A|nr:hypothetical protein [Rhodopirellula sp. JC737]MCC9655139.1 hypothetical protein [Rhodopirellula sp. JC737]